MIFVWVSIFLFLRLIYYIIVINKSIMYDKYSIAELDQLILAQQKTLALLHEVRAAKFNAQNVYSDTDIKILKFCPIEIDEKGFILFNGAKTELQFKSNQKIFLSRLLQMENFGETSDILLAGLKVSFITLHKFLYRINKKFFLHKIPVSISQSGDFAQLIF